MNFDAQELVSTAQELQNKLDGITPAELQQLTNIPSPDQFSQVASSLLPENFVTQGVGGIQNLLSPTNLINKLTQGVSSLVPQMQGQATGLLNTLAGKVLGSFSGFNASEQVDQASSMLSQMSDNIATQSAQQMVGALNNLTQGAQLGNLQTAMETGIKSVSNLSPKGIRDLTNPTNFTNKLTTAINNAKSNLTGTAQQMAEDLANNAGFTNSGQLPLQQLSSPMFSGDNTNGFQLAVRITAYWSKGAGTDFYTAKKISSTGRTLAEGYSAAVDPVIIPYLSRIEIPGVGTRFAVDTGGAVKARKASGGRRPIIDVYFETRQAAKAFLSQLKSEELIVTVYPPKTQYKYAKNSPPLYGTA